MEQQPGNQQENWLPLESNPAVMNPYCKDMGFSIDKFEFQDLLSTDDWAQDMIQKPVLAVMFLYPLKESTVEFDKQENKTIKEQGQVVSPNLFYMRQFARNACGTIAAMHAILNADPSLVKPDSIFGKFLSETAKMTPEERGNYFLGAQELKEAHVQAVNSEVSQSEVSSEVDSHFIAFVEKDGHIYELDGRKDFPINHGKTTKEAFLADTCLVVKKFMERDQGELNFATIVLAPPQEE